MRSGAAAIVLLLTAALTTACTTPDPVGDTGPSGAPSTSAGATYRSLEAAVGAALAERQVAFHWPCDQFLTGLPPEEWHCLAAGVKVTSAGVVAKVRHADDYHGYSWVVLLEGPAGEPARWRVLAVEAAREDEQYSWGSATERDGTDLPSSLLVNGGQYANGDAFTNLPFDGPNDTDADLLD